MHGEHLETPVPPFGGAEDFAVNERFVAFTAKDPKLNPAWHTKQNVSRMLVLGVCYLRYELT